MGERARRAMCSLYNREMPKTQRTVLGKGEFHWITCACFRHQAKLGVEKHRNLLCQLLEELRSKYRFEIAGYVVMPTALQLLMTEPGRETAETVLLLLKQRYQRRYNTSVRSDEPAWEKVIADTHVVTADHMVGALNLMHHAPLKAGLVEKMTDWEWSSARRYAGMPEGVVTIEPFVDERAAIAE